MTDNVQARVGLITLVNFHNALRLMFALLFIIFVVLGLYDQKQFYSMLYYFKQPCGAEKKKLGVRYQSQPVHVVCNSKCKTKPKKKRKKYGFHLGARNIHCHTMTVQWAPPIG